MDFKTLRFQNRSRKALRQIYAVIYYMENGFTRLKAVRKTARDFSRRYNTINGKLGREFAKSVYTFDQWYSTGELLAKLRHIFRLRGHDVRIFRALLEQDIAKSHLFLIVTEDVKSMEAEEKEPELEPTEGREGKQSLRMIRYFERNPKLRIQAINYHGLECTVCGFNFDKVYGQRGANYIEVHHHKPISSYGGQIEVDPKNDMTVLCCNCHRMIHRYRRSVLTVEKLKAIVNGDK